MTEQSSPSSAALISALRAAPVNAAVEGMLKMRVHSRLSVSLLGLTPTLGGTSPTTHDALATSRSSGSTASQGLAANKAILLACLAPVFALGVLTGVAADRWHQHAVIRSSPPTTAPATHQDAPLAPQPEPPHQAITPSDLDEFGAAKRSAQAAPAPAPSDANSTLAAERRLLDEARQALAHGEPGAGLAPLDRHATRYPKGVLTEEREALAVRLLAALGQNAAATNRAENFHRRFPNSLFTPAVNNAIATISRRNAESESKP
jgi:hypothetical protein